MSLETKLVAYASPLDMLRHAQTGRYQFLVAPEFSNWAEEQKAWRRSASPKDQSYHMTDLYPRGPDVVRLLSDLSVNSYSKFGRDKAKQIICCNDEGYLIGDCILFGLENDLVNDGSPLTTKFFDIGEITIAGCKAGTLCHGMARAAVLGIRGPVNDGPKVHARQMETGRKHGLRQAGSKAYSTASAESDWMSSPLPAICSGERMKAFREWLGDDAF